MNEGENSFLGEEPVETREKDDRRKLLLSYASYFMPFSGYPPERGEDEERIKHSWSNN